MKILYLYTEVMGYTLATINELRQTGAEIHLVYWHEKRLTPYKTPTSNKLFLYPK